MMEEDYDDPFLRESYKHYTQELLHDQSVTSQLTNKFWTAKSLVRKLKKKEDQSVVAADSDLDAKLEFYKSIQETTQKLVFCIERYQDAIMALSQEENKLGRFLKEQAQIDKSPAGKMMSAIGRQLSQTSQQRLSCRVPLVRLYGDLDTFRNRAIADTNLNVQKMEALRIEYRGTLMWMKDISQELNPDAYRQLEKFRKVQAQVKINRDRFEKHKYAVCQKIDLLGASRCNLLSHDLEVYHQNMLAFWQRTAKEMSEICEQFKGHQHYEWSMLKELNEPSLKLHEQLEKNMKVEDRNSEGTDSVNGENKQSATGDEKLISWDETGGQDSAAGQGHLTPSSSFMHANDSSFSRESSAQQHILSNSSAGTNIEQLLLKDVDLLSDLTNDPNNDSLLRLASPGSSKAADDNFFDDVENANFFNDLLNPSEGSENHSSGWDQMFTSSGQTSSWNQPGGSQTHPPLTSSDSFGMYSEAQMPSIQSESGAGSFLPSQLMDFSNLDKFQSMLSAASGLESQSGRSLNPFQQQQLSPGAGNADLFSTASGAPNGNVSSAGQGKLSSPSKSQSSQQSKPTLPAKSKKDMSAWFDLFADLDPLGNPDAVGSSKDQQGEKIGI